VTLLSDELGLEDDYYIEEVTFSRSPQTITTLKLMRKWDVMYLGESDFVEPAFKDVDATQPERSVDLGIGSAGQF
jgi:hypothetical protein